MFVKRDSDGRVIAVSLREEPGFAEQLDAGDPGLLEFHATSSGNEAGLSAEAQRLRSSDVELVRVVEDIINLLTDKGVIQFTELPESAQQKLLQRRILRQHIQHLDLISDDDSDQGML